jgi:hypothetical protein
MWFSLCKIFFKQELVAMFRKIVTKCLTQKEKG